MTNRNDFPNPGTKGHSAPIRVLQYASTAPERTMATVTATTRRVDRNGYGFSIRQEGDAWFGYEWQRRSCFEVDSTCIAGPLTEAEAAAWIATC